MGSLTETIKEHIDLADYARSQGIELSNHGRNDLKGLCPFHADKTPSLIISPKKQLFNCPACGSGGSVIDFAMKLHKLDIKEAIKLLKEELPGSNGAAKKETNQSEEPAGETLVAGENLYPLLERAVDFYEKTFAESHEGRYYLDSRGLSDAGQFTKHGAGYANGSLLNALPKEGDILSGLEQLGILVKLKDGNYIERFRHCVVFPVLDPDGNIVTLYGRSIDGASKRRHLYLPNRPTGLFNSGVVRHHSEVILVESVLDALSVETAGLENVISIQSTKGLSDDDIALLRQYEVGRVLLLLDGDKAGSEASVELMQRLSAFFDVVNIPLPDGHDPNSYLQECGAVKLRGLFSLAADEKPSALSVEAEVVNSTTGSDRGYSSLRSGLREYRLIGIDKRSRSLKATVRVEKSGKVHVDTIDFYSARQRQQLARDLCILFEEVPDTVNSDIGKLMNLCEAYAAKKEKDGRGEQQAVYQLSDKEREDAEAFAKTPDLVERILLDYETCGLIGENSNRLLTYLAMTSRKMPEPLSVLILSSSGAGKTALQDTALAFCPPEDLVKLTNLSGKALFYKEQTSLKHKVLAIEEGAGAEEASYAIRNLISSEGLTSEVAVRDPSTGKLTTMTNTVEGPLAVFCTTTDPNVDPETRSRFLVTGIDESREQTRRILAFQKNRHTLKGLQLDLNKARVLALHRNFQRLLEPVAVVNPHIGQLNYDDDRLQGRRAQPQYLNLINTVAFLRQKQKQVKTCSSEAAKEALRYVEVDETDIEIGKRLAIEILGRTLDELSIPARDLLSQVNRMLDHRMKRIIEKEGKDTTVLKRDLTFTRRNLRDHTGWTQTRLRNHLRELLELEYLVLDSGGNGRTLQFYRLLHTGKNSDGSAFIPGGTGAEGL